MPLEAPLPQRVEARTLASALMHLSVVFQTVPDRDAWPDDIELLMMGAADALMTCWGHRVDPLDLSALLEVWSLPPQRLLELLEGPEGSGWRGEGWGVRWAHLLEAFRWCAAQAGVREVSHAAAS